MPEMTVNLRASKAPAWLACPRKAMMETLNPEPPPAAAPIAMVYGNLVHEALTGAPADVGDGSIAYDGITRSRAELDRQVERAVDVLANTIDTDRIVAQEAHMERVVGPFHAEATGDFDPDHIDSSLLRTEAFDFNVNVSGHIDLVIEEPRNEVSILDIKTGQQRQQPAWAQMAMYCWLAGQEGWGQKNALIAWAPRGKVDPTTGEQLVEISWKSAAALKVEAVRIIQFVVQQTLQVTTVAIPGAHCAWCRHETCQFVGDGAPKND